MADRLTQLQDCVNEQADHFCNSIGILQQFSSPSKFPGFERCTTSLTATNTNAAQLSPNATPSNTNSAAVTNSSQSQPQQQQQQQQPVEEYIHLFSQLITRTAKDIDTLIDSLPSEESSIDLQVTSLRHLELENQEAADNLNLSVRVGQNLLEQVQEALCEISQAQLDMRKIDW